MSSFTLYPFSSAPRVSFRFDGRILYTSDRFELIHLVLQPGESMEPHTQPIDIVFFVAEGEGSLAVDGEVMEVPAKSTVHVKAGVSRSWANTGQVPLILLVSKIL